MIKYLIFWLRHDLLCRLLPLPDLSLDFDREGGFFSRLMAFSLLKGLPNQRVGLTLSGVRAVSANLRCFKGINATGTHFILYLLGLVAGLFIF